MFNKTKDPYSASMVIDEDRKHKRYTPGCLTNLTGFYKEVYAYSDDYFVKSF